MKKSYPGGCSQAGESSIDALFIEIIEKVSRNLNQDNLKLVGTHFYKK